MNRFLVTILLCSWSIPLFAQDEVSQLRNRVAQLESETRRLRQQVFMLTCMHKIQNGYVTTATIEGDRKAKIVFANAGWGEGRPQDVAAVCVSAAETVFSAIKPEKGKEPTIFVIPDDAGPIVLTQRGPNGEYFVLLSARDRHWSQVAYQFSHELGHVLCGDLSLRMPQHWFEESFCESVSLWTLDSMGKSWQTNPPYANWKGYASSLTSYVANVRKRVPDVSEVSKWFDSHRDLLTREAYDRDKNLIVAKKLATFAHENQGFYQSFYYLRKGNDPQTNSMEWLLANWIENCPEQLRFGPEKVSELLNVTPRK